MKGFAYCCFLPDLTRFTSFHCGGPNFHHHLPRANSKSKNRGGEFHPAIADFGYWAPLLPHLARQKALYHIFQRNSILLVGLQILFKHRGPPFFITCCSWMDRVCHISIISRFVHIASFFIVPKIYDAYVPFFL